MEILDWARCCEDCEEFTSLLKIMEESDSWYLYSSLGAVVKRTGLFTTMLFRRGAKQMKYLRALKKLFRDESGQDLIEYALVAALIALGSVVMIQGVGSSISTVFTQISSQLATVP
jgi:pilus assembly protein Flp/PilA